MPPHSLEAEACLLGACIIDPPIIDDVLAIVRPDDFYAQAHQTIFEAIIRCHERKAGGDILALSLTLADSLPRIGGMDALERLVLGTPSSAGALRYARTVRDKARLRRIIDAASQVIFDARAAVDGEADAVLAACEQRIFDACATVAMEDVRSLPEVIAEDLARMEEIADGTHTADTVPSAWPGVDAFLNGGARAGEMIVVAARPGMGKTAFGVEWSIACARSGVPVLFVSLEMSAVEVARRAVSMMGPIPLSEIVKGAVTESGRDRVAELRDADWASGIYLYDRADTTFAQIHAVARRMRRRKGIGAVVIDYLQLITLGNFQHKRYEEVTAISRKLKMMAKSLGVPVITLAQLNRENVKGRKDFKPRMSDLRDSGAVEQDANVIILLHREGYYHDCDSDWLASNNPNAVDLIIAKNRNGETGTVPSHWQPATARFQSVAH